MKVKQLTLKKYLQQSAFKRNKQSHKIGSAMLIEQLFTLQVHTVDALCAGFSSQEMKMLLQLVFMSRCCVML